jgi:hypothetical protein
LGRKTSTSLQTTLAAEAHNNNNNNNNNNTTFTLGQVIYILSMMCELYDNAGQIGQSPFSSGSNN